MRRSDLIKGRGVGKQFWMYCILFIVLDGVP